MSGMGSWNGMWHDLRNGIIMRKVMYAECFNKFNSKAALFLEPI